MEQKRKNPNKKLQIRVMVDREQYNELKIKAKELKLSLEHYSGLILSGYSIVKKEIE